MPATPILVKPASQYVDFFVGSTAASEASHKICRADYVYHQLQVSCGATAVNFVLYTSNDGSTWAPIKNQTDLDETVSSYASTAKGVLQLTGCFPYLQLIRGSGETGSAFSASLYSTGKTIV